MMELAPPFNKAVMTAATLIGCLGLAKPSSSAELFRSGDTSLRWDNTIQYSAAVRLEKPQQSFITDPNGDDGERNFAKGFAWNRFDLLSELDVAFSHWGVAASAAAWYDTVYNASPNPTKRLPNFYPPPASFAPAVQRLHGSDAELLNGFVYLNSNVGDLPVSLRVGRHTVLWGESLFFAENGIAAGQAPVDAIKALSVPLVRAKEVYMPVAQASGSIQISPTIAVEAYYQFEWRKSRLPGAGSYFSTADYLDAGGSKLYVGRNQYLTRSTNLEPGQTGQFGVALRWTRGDTDYGFYALRFHAKDPQLYLRSYGAGSAGSAQNLERSTAYGTGPGVFGGPSSPLLDLYPGLFGSGTGSVGAYTLVYPRGIEIYGASISGYMGDSNVAAEISARRRMPFVSTALVAAVGAAADGDNHPLYARGDSLHAQVSMITALAPGRLWDAANFSTELAMNRRLAVTDNAAALDPTRDKFAATIRGQFEPTYFAVLPGLDIGTPISVGYGLAGRSSVSSDQVAGTGSVEFGISATYRAVWRASLGMTYFIGGWRRQPLADRNFISFSVQRTF